MCGVFIYQWSPICVEITNANVRYKLAERHDEKVEIEEKLELLIEHEREEGDNVVLLIADGVRRILALRGPPDEDGAVRQLAGPAASLPHGAPAAGTETGGLRRAHTRGGRLRVAHRPKITVAQLARRRNYVVLFALTSWSD